MYRKTLLLIFALVAALNAIASQYASQWYKFPLYTDNVDQIIESSDKVYFRSGNSLFSFSPTDNETYCYSALNKLADNTIDQIFYNFDKKYLFIAYDNGNIDILFDDGKIVNMPDIKDSSLSMSKNILDVAFDNDHIAVGTDFGIVIFNDEKFEVVESGIYGGPISKVLLINDHILIWDPKTTGYAILGSPLNIRHNNIDKFSKVAGNTIYDFFPISDTHIVIRNFDNVIDMRKMNFSNLTYQRVNLPEDYKVTGNFQKYKGGCYAYNDTQLLDITPEGVTVTPLPDAVQGLPLSLYDGFGKVWAASPDGIARFDVSSATVLNDWMLPAGCITDQRVGYMKYSNDGKRLYISNLELSQMRSYSNGEDSPNYQTTNIINSDGRIVDASIKEVEQDHDMCLRMQTKFDSKRMFGVPARVVEDPDNPDIYYIANYFEGLYVCKLNDKTGEYEVIGLFDETNSTIQRDTWAIRTHEVFIDHQGNLWVGTQNPNIFSVLPAAKRKLDPKTITAADWRTYSNMPEEYRGRDLQMIICQRSDMMFYICSKYEKGFVAIDTKGTLTNPDDDTIYHWNRIVDQDGNDLLYQYITFLIEDDRGCVWVGTTAGIFEITNPANATNPAMTVRRIKVPRNDGTNYADYLLESEFINWIAVDASDRKWVATQNSGIYLVSETGDAILAHFDTDNSPLPSNSVWTIECDKFDNTVYVGTGNGLYSFKGDSAPAHTDFNDIYAFPNPVRPEYSGLVTITGLMDNSLVKITDSMGSVVAETKSEGGMAVWDVCDFSGARVKSGVYYVYASQSGNGSSSGAVTKILVIN